MRASGPHIAFPPRISRRQTMIGASAGFSAFVLGLDGVRAAHSQAGSSVVTRLDIVELAKDAAKLAKLEAALKEMQDRSASDPKDPSGWLVNARAHAEFCPIATTASDQIHFCWWFLPWHRAYLSVTERKLRQIASDDSLALPYWNWSSDRHIPAPYAKAASPFAKAVRYTPGRAVQDGEVDYFPQNPARKKLGVAALGARLYQAASGAQIATSFGGIARPNPANQYGNNRLEGTPHGPIHVYVGGVNGQGDPGDMTDFETAGRDPIFFAHHANLDRLWEIWRQTPEHRQTEPQSADFLNKEFPFTWLDGNVIMVKVADVMDTQKLGYVYDSLSVFRPPAQAPIVSAQSAAAPLPPIAKETLTAPFSAQAAGPGVRKILEITDVEKPDRPMTVGVNVKPANAPANEPGENVGTFSAIRAGGEIAWPSRTLAFDITDAVDRYGGEKLTVELVPFRIQSTGAETYPPLRYGQMRIVTEER
jgi:Common central domain of tyrosinase/Polyphenol oxidase middle domain